MPVQRQCGSHLGLTSTYGFQRFANEPSEGVGERLGLFAAVGAGPRGRSADRALSLCSSCGTVDGWHKT